MENKSMKMKARYLNVFSIAYRLLNVIFHRMDTIIVMKMNRNNSIHKRKTMLNI